MSWSLYVNTNSYSKFKGILLFNYYLKTCYSPISTVPKSIILGNYSLNSYLLGTGYACIGITKLQVSEFIRKVS